MLKKTFSDQFRKSITTRYFNGESVSALCAEHNVARSTLYYWVKQFHPLKTVTDTVVYYKEYLELKRHADKLENQLAVLQAAGCGTAASLQEKLVVMEKLHGQFSVHALCEALCVARGTFYNHIFRRKDVTLFDKRREEMRERVLAVFHENKKRYGAKKICAVLQEEGIQTSERYVTELMREMNLYSFSPTARREYNKRAKETKRKNILQRQFKVSAPNCVWVSDVTCFKVKDQYMYICVIIDLYSRKIVAHAVSSRNSTYLITSTFRRAFQSRNKPEGLIFHSDRGVQYTSEAFRRLLHVNKVVQSFSKTGSPHDNAVSEAFFSSMKKEELYRVNYRSEREFRVSVEEYIRFYNEKRPHGTLMFKTPDRFEAEYYNEKQAAE